VDKSSGKCFKCGKSGHLKAQCPQQAQIVKKVAAIKAEGDQADAA
jgi:hypothetical protein